MLKANFRRLGPRDYTYVHSIKPPRAPLVAQCPAQCKAESLWLRKSKRYVPVAMKKTQGAPLSQDQGMATGNESASGWDSTGDLCPEFAKTEVDLPRDALRRTHWCVCSVHNSPNPLASIRRRFARCFSMAGERPSLMARLASMQSSRARASDKSAGPYFPKVTVSRRPFIR